MRTSLKLIAFVLALTASFTGTVIALELPASAVLTREEQSASDQQQFPTGPFSGADTLIETATGSVLRRAYRLSGSSMTPLQMAGPLLAQLESDGYEVAYSCTDRLCGGFDFRFMLDLLPEPEMHIDLGNFHYIFARHDNGDCISIITSRAPTTGFIHVTTVKKSTTPHLEIQPTIPLEAHPKAAQAQLKTASLLGQDLQEKSHIALDDLSFETGSSTLGDGPFPSLQFLADFLDQNPEFNIILVGHTDSVGSLEANRSLSLKRATSVRQRLISQYSVAKKRVSATGIGFLAPRTSNASEEGREHNRRVEAILAPTQ